MTNPKNLYNAWTLAKLNEITVANSAFGSFEALVNAKGDYAPTINCESLQGEILADSYDEFQACRNDSRRAFRR